MPTVPLSKNLTDFLEEEYKTKTGEGLDDATLAEILQVSMPAIIIFNQIDCDHSGKVSMRELYRLLRALPRNKPIPPEGGWPNGEAPKFVPPEEMIKIFDTDGDGEISVTEFVDNLAKLPGLQRAIETNTGPDGKIRTYVSLEERMANLSAEAEPLEAKAAAGEELGEADKATLEDLRSKIAKIKASVGSAGLSVFRQLDADKSGKIDRAELMALLKALPAARAQKGLDGWVAELDVDGDGVIDEDEWVAQLGRLPALAALIESGIDPTTGKLKNLPPVEALPEETAPAETAPAEAPLAEAVPGAAE